MEKREHFYAVSVDKSWKILHVYLRRMCILQLLDRFSGNIN